MSYYMHFPATAAPEEIDEAFSTIPEVEGERPLAVRLTDGSYALIGTIVRAIDCPPEIFNQAMKILEGVRIEK